MPFLINTTNNYEALQEINTKELICPLSNVTETMTLQLYQLHSDTTLLGKKTWTKIEKEITGVFYRASTGEEIAARSWTTEMEDFFNRQKNQAAAKPKKMIFTLYGKIVLGFSFALLLTMIIFKYRKHA